MKKNSLGALCGLLLVLVGCSGGGGGSASTWGNPTPEQGAFFEAARDGKVAEVDAALKAHPDWVGVRRCGSTALHEAVRYGHMAVVKSLLSHGADLDARDSVGETPLAMGITYGTMEMIQFLLDSGADVMTVNDSGRTLLHRAANSNPRFRKEGPEIVALLIKKGLDVKVRGDASGLTPLHMAAMGGDEKIALLLIDHGADVSAKDRSGQTPLAWARQANNPGIVNLLQKHGAM